MKRFLPLAIIAGLVMSACDTEAESLSNPPRRFYAGATVISSASPALQTRPTFERRVRNELSKFESRIEDLEVKARIVSSKDRMALDRACLELEKKRRSAHTRLSELESSTVEASEAGRPAVEAGLVALRKAYEEAASALR